MLKKTKAFTLIEVLISLTIISMVVLALVSSQGMTIKSTKKAQVMTLATFAARNLMTEIEIMIEQKGFDYINTLEQKTESDFEEEIYKGWKWEREINEVNFPLSELFNAYSSMQNATQEADQDYEQNTQDTQMLKMITDSVSSLIKEAVKEVSIKVFWPIRGGSDFSNIIIVYYIIDFNKINSFIPSM